MKTKWKSQENVRKKIKEMKNRKKIKTKADALKTNDE